jgi:hypothetical protein
MAQDKPVDVVELEIAESRRISMRLDPEPYQRLQVHAIMEFRSPAQVATELVLTHLTEWEAYAERGSKAAAWPQTDSAV